jgi:ABC-2 type transport system permease protein
MSDTTTQPRSFRGPALAAALIELRLMATPRRGLVLCVLVGLASLIGLAIQMSGAVPVPAAGTDTWPLRYAYNAFLRGVLPLAALYIGTSLWSDEVESGTLVYLITRPVARPAVLLAKFLAAWAVVTAMVFVGLAATIVPLGLMRGSGIGGLVGCAVVLPAASLAWVGLATFFGTTIRRCLLLALGVGAVMELVLANFDAVARTVSLGHHVGSALHAIAPFTEVRVEEMVTGEPVAAWVAWLVLLAVGVGALALGCVRVRYAEYVPTRSD